jgi:3'(2'), 5'-bisphosphate nucleotidase
VLGIVYAPVSGVCYYACRGCGAYKRKGRGKAVSIRVRAINAAEPMVVTGSRSHNVGDALNTFMSHLPATRYLPMGSAMKSCIVAEGGADIYPRFGPTGEWDTAAAQCIVEEAGGGFTDLALRPLRYNERDTLLNPHFLVFGDKSYDWTTPLKESRLLPAC